MKPFANVRCVKDLWFLMSQACQEKHLRSDAAALADTNRSLAAKREDERRS